MDMKILHFAQRVKSNHPAVIPIVLVGFFVFAFSSVVYSSDNNPQPSVTVDALADSAIADFTYSYRVKADESDPKITDIINKQDWDKPTSGTPNFGYTRHTYWFKVTLRTKAKNQSGLYYYVVDYPVLDYLHFYLVANDQVEAKYITGDKLPYSHRPVESNKFVFPVALGDSDEKTIYVRLSTQGTLQLPAKLLTQDEFHRDELSFYLLQGLFVGVIGIMLFYNLALWYVFRTRDYIFYVLYGVSMLTVQLTMLGLSFEYLWPNATQWNNTVIPFAITCTVLFMLLFTHSFLNIHLNRAKVSRVIQGYCIALSLFALASLVMPYESAIKIAMISVIVGLALALAAAVDALRYSFSFARLYLISWAGVVIGAVSLALTKFGILPTNVLTANSWQIGTGIEITLLSFALAAKIRAVTDAKLAAEKKAQKATALYTEHLEQYKAIYNNSIEGLFKIDLINNKILYNESFAKLNGLELGLGESNDQSFIERIVDRLHLDHCSIDRTTNMLRRDEEQVTHQLNGVDVWFAIKRRYIENENHEVVAIEGSVVDISDRKLKEKAEVKLLDALKKTDKIKNEFFSTISHELLTPLNGINGHLQLLSDEMPDNEHINGMEFSAAEMLMLVNRILNFSQLHAGSLVLEPVSFSIAGVMDPLRIKYSHICRAKSLAFEIHIDEPIPKVIFGDRQKIFQVLDELMANAVKFTPQGKVTLTIQSQARQPVNADEETGIYRFIFSVTDTGIGIEQQDTDKVFTLFQQADGSNTRRYGGVGLGLYLSKALCDMMDGDIVLDSKPGEGSRFDFVVDLQAQHTRELGHRKNRKNRNNSTKPINKDAIKLLVVEDNNVNQTIMKGMLKSLGFHCQIAENGEVALKMLQNETFDLIFMDCQMPIMDGFQATKMIRAQAVGQQNIPIVAVTANAMSGDRERCLEVGMNDFIQKPVTRDAIRKTVEQWLFVQSVADAARLSVH